MPDAVINKSSVHLYLMLFLIAASYFVLAELSLLFSFQTSNATPVWPPSGLAFALMLHYGNRIAPAILAGAFAANVVVFSLNNAADNITIVWVSFIICIGNTAETLTGWSLLRKLVPGVSDNNYFNNVNHIFRFLLVTIVMCLVSSIIGTTAVYSGSIIDSSHYFTTWLTWWLGDVSGIILITPAILIWIDFFRNSNSGVTPWKRYRVRMETILFFALVVLASGIVFDNWIFKLGIFRWSFWIFPVVVWAGIRFKQHVTVVALLICSVISILGTVSGHGTFSGIPVGEADVDLNASLLALQSFICIVTVSALALNASVNERKQTEAKLRELSNQLEKSVAERTDELKERHRFIETLFDSVEDLMAVFDKEGNYISVNKKVEEVYSKKREDIIGKNILDVFPSLRNSEMTDNLKKASSGQTVHSIAYRSPVTGRYYENFYVPLRNEWQEIYGVLLIGHDNTAIMEAAEKLETANTKLTEAQRLAHIGNWEWNIVEDKITWSDELYRIFGLVPREFEASFPNYLRYIHPDEREHVRTIVQDALINREPFSFYHRVVRPDGTIRILHGRGEIHMNDDKQPISMAGTAQDVTELKQAENEVRKITDELMRYNKELEQTNKALESFTFVASHDLQEPVRKIRTFLNLITEKETANLSEKSKDYINRTVRAATQMQQLIHDLLLYSRTTSSAEHFKKTDLNIILRDVTIELKEMIEEKHASIEAGKLPELEVIPFQFHQFFINMISNSLKFSGADRKPQIHIKADIADSNSIELNNGGADKTYYRITITDNGIGFDARYDEKIFDLFQRLHSKHKYSGTGIGLAICKKIIENHDGFITAHGEPDKGATFIIYLPERQTFGNS